MNKWYRNPAVWILMAGFAIFNFWSFRNHPIAAAICYCVLLWFILAIWRRNKRNRQRHLDALKAAFAGSELPIPQLEDSTSYGYPRFKLTFQSEADLNRAEASGCIAKFKEIIWTLYGHVGGKQNPFDVDRAVSATYVGWTPYFKIS